MEDLEHDKQMLLFTDEFAALSKDPSTKVGASIGDEGEETPKAFGYNGMPRGLDDFNEERNQRPEKYFWYEHAETNAIYNKARDLMEHAIIFCSHFPSMDSARAIVSSGIKIVITDYDEKFHIEYLRLRKEKQLDNHPEYKNYERVRALFNETNTTLYQPSRALLSKGAFNEAAKNDTPLLKKYIQYLDITKSYGIKMKAEENKAAFILDKRNMGPIGIGMYMPPYKFKGMTPERYAEKNFWYIDAEKNAIFNAVRPILKNSTFHVSWCPCMNCALAISAVGAKKVVTRQPLFNTEAELRWKDHFIRSEQLFKEMSIETIFFSKEELEFSNSLEKKQVKLK